MASRFPVPFSSSRELRGSDPLLELHREMNRLFDNVFSGSGLMGMGSQGNGMSVLRLDVKDTGREICISAELPGVNPSEVDLRLEGNTITLSGEKKSESETNEENYHVMERSYGRFRRTVELPFAPNPDDVRAESNNGVLTIHVPKQAQQETSRRIEVRSSSGSGSEGSGGDMERESGERSDGGSSIDIQQQSQGDSGETEARH